MKKVMLYVLAVTILLCACGKNEENQNSSGVTEQESNVVQSDSGNDGNTDDIKTGDNEQVTISGNDVVKETDWKGIYSEFLLSLDKSVEDTSYNPFNYISLCDFNFDGIPELIVSDDAASAAWSFAIYQIVEDKIERIFGHSAFAELSGDKYLHEGEEYFNCYSNFEKGWIKSVKDIQTGERRYVILTGNGSDCESFDSIYSVLADSETGILKVQEDFYCCIYNRMGEYAEDAPAEDDYRVGGKISSEEEYNKQLKNFEDKWQDTGYRSVEMVPELRFEHWENPQKVSYGVSSEKLEEFFDMFVAEQTE